MELKPFERVLRCIKCAKYTDPEYMGATYCEGGEVAAEKLAEARKEQEEAKGKDPMHTFIGSSPSRWERCQGIDIEHLHVRCECGFEWLMHTADHPEHAEQWLTRWQEKWGDTDDVVG